MSATISLILSRPWRQRFDRLFLLFILIIISHTFHVTMLHKSIFMCRCMYASQVDILGEDIEDNAMSLVIVYRTIGEIAFVEVEIMVWTWWTKCYLYIYILHELVAWSSIVPVDVSAQRQYIFHGRHYRCKAEAFPFCQGDIKMN